MNFIIFADVEEYEVLNYEAIIKIHNHLDDDRNGEVDLSESDEVLKPTNTYM